MRVVRVLPWLGDAGAGVSPGLARALGTGTLCWAADWSWKHHPRVTSQGDLSGLF